ncbi:MAG: hypothetical protein JSS02_02755 [Planctomycetes bacterium]|nr:hypothetical protein [Planctomycetota bacterium]
MKPTDPQQPPQSAPSEFEQAGQEQAPSLAAEFWLFITESKKWWMIPILVVMGLVGVLILLSATGFAPFIYTIF